MIWLCAHSANGLRPETFNAVMTLIPETETVRFHDVDGDDKEYGRILADCWEKAVGLAVIEQDIVPRADVVEAFLNCPEPWCCFPYPCTNAVIPALGCSRFDAGFLTMYPDAMEQALLEPGGYGAGHYRSVDFVLFRDVLAFDYGLQPHIHLPPVEHLNEKQRLLPSASPEPVTMIDAWYGVGAQANRP